MLKILSDKLNLNKLALEDWYQKKLVNATRCFYSSVDLRYSGNKLVPVDCNLFPAGFNNLNQDNIISSANIVKEYLEKNFSDVKKILLIAEDHTRNLHYLDNLETIKKIILKAGYECCIASLTSSDDNLYQGIIYSDINIMHLSRKENKLSTQDFVPDLIILNNDLMGGLPEILKDLDQLIIPHPNNGWFKRRKSNHFKIYNQLAEELEDIFDIPSVMLTTEFAVCENVNFKTKIGLDDLAEKVRQVLERIRIKYQKYNISEDPYVVIKSDYGTYGMGVMIVRSAEEVYILNKKIRKQMHVTKHNIVNEQVLIQEGVKTIDTINDHAAEPLLYLINHQQVAFLYRSHHEKDDYSNLNSVGMKITNHKHDFNEYSQCCNFVACLASLASALEI